MKALAMLILIVAVGAIMMLASSIGHRIRRKADIARANFLDSLQRRFPICPNCGALPEIEWTWANVFSECPECAMEFTRNQWYGRPQADDYPGGPLDKFRFRK